MKNGIKSAVLVIFGTVVGLTAGVLMQKAKVPKIGSLTVLPGEDGLTHPVLALTLDNQDSVFKILKSEKVIMDVEILKDSQ